MQRVFLIFPLFYSIFRHFYQILNFVNLSLQINMNFQFFVVDELAFLYTHSNVHIHACMIIQTNKQTNISPKPNSSSFASATWLMLLDPLQHLASYITQFNKFKIMLEKSFGENCFSFRNLKCFLLYVSFQNLHLIYVSR